MSEFYDQDDDGSADENISFEEIELPNMPEANDFIELLSDFFIEADRKEKRAAMAVKRGLQSVLDNHGQSASIAAIHLIQKFEGWDLEILLEKSDVEDYLMKVHDIYDDDIWDKVLNTDAMSDFRRRVYTLSQTYLAVAVQEVLEREPINRAGLDGRQG